VAARSAGIVVYRRCSEGLEFLLVHPGGPYWAKKDEGAWSIPKGEFEAGEEPLEAAKREFSEETGFFVAGTPVPLTPLRQPSGKIVHAWAVEQDLDPSRFRSNTFPLEWPPGSGRTVEVPEIDKVAWFGLDEARRKIRPGQAGFLDQLLALPSVSGGPARPPT
jgi:predicted NUDIX family NTP pyrophosphohydrolase